LRKRREELWKGVSDTALEESDWLPLAFTLLAGQGANSIIISFQTAGLIVTCYLL